MGIYYSKPIGDLMKCSASKTKSSNPSGIAWYENFGIVTTNANIDLLHEKSQKVQSSSTNHKIARAKPFEIRENSWRI